MDGAHLAHLAVLCAWALVVLVEAVLELGLRGTDERRRRVARMHFWIDVLVEVPLLIGVLSTGALLTARAWPPSPRLEAKIGLGLLAVGLNGYCAMHVVLRHRRAEDPGALARHGRRVLLSALGIPPALAAAYLGAAPWLGWGR